MIAFEVRDMYSSRSAGAIVKSVKAVDGRAQVRVDLAAHSVEIEPDHALPQELSEAIGRAGFTAVAVVPPAALAPDSTPPRKPPPKIAFDGTVDVLLTWD
ncbi:MAG: heavy metal-associated domain-containing protein [Burkholderiaceae bacterium]